VSYSRSHAIFWTLIVTLTTAPATVNSQTPQGAETTKTVDAEEAVMSANGTFEVDLTPQEDVGSPAGRMLIQKTYLGDMNGSGIGQMISKRTENGTAVYYAIEEFSGSLKGKSGGFTLVHKGHMSKESRSLEVNILEGSGSGELQDISGSMLIVQDPNGHKYKLTFDL
jgi:hypothetical protein